MKASVAPISLITSISSRRVSTCRRMVLKVTATSASASNPPRIATTQRPSRNVASSRRAHAPSSCTYATRGHCLISSRNASSAGGVLSLALMMKASGSGFCGRLSTTSASPLDCLSSCKAWSRDRKRKRCTRGFCLRRVSICATSVLLALSAMNALTCGSIVS